LSGDELAGLTEQLDELEALKQQLMLTCLRRLGKGYVSGTWLPGAFQ
jgi:hypothetical protein